MHNAASMLPIQTMRRMTLSIRYERHILNQWSRPAKSGVEMHEVSYFLALCEERNFRRAAKCCGISQPSLTTAIKSLEAKLGGPLFNRNPRETVLTKFGKLICPHMMKIFHEANQAIETAKSFTKKNSSKSVGSCPRRRRLTQPDFLKPSVVRK